MGKGRRIEEKNVSKIKFIRNIIIVLIVLGIIAFILWISPDYAVPKQEGISLIINNRNVTSNLKNDILIEDDIIYLSKPDVANFFDKYIYEDDETNQIITTYDKKIASIGFDNNVININGSEKDIYAHAIEKNGIIYLPISEMDDVYDVEIDNIEETKVVTMDSLDRGQKKAIVTSNLAVKSSTNFIAKTVDRVNKGDTVIVISSEDGYSRIRTSNGKIGYIKSKKLENEFTVREDMEDEKQVEGRINLTWDYFSQYGQAPDRSGTTIDGVNVVSPAFFYLDTDGKLKANVGESGKEYIEWAHSNGYKVWPMVANAEAARESLDITSEIMNSYLKRQELIEDIINYCVEYDLDGVNIDFENMKQEDIDMYSRFIIELTPRLKEIGLVTSVDVTAPDGGETWSMCFDRNVIGDVADYIVFMAYDQYGVSSNKPGTTAGYNWVELSLNKFLTTEEIEPEKIILAVPLYTRVWTVDTNGEVVSNPTIAMKDIDSRLPEGVEKQWDDELKQNYVEYSVGNDTRKIWIEDIESLKAKVSLITENNLAGVASWQKGMETEEFWEMLKEELH